MISFHKSLIEYRKHPTQSNFIKVIDSFDKIQDFLNLADEDGEDEFGIIKSDDGEFSVTRNLQKEGNDALLDDLMKDVENKDKHIIEEHESYITVTDSSYDVKKSGDKFIITKDGEDAYYVTRNGAGNLQCNCTGFKYRHKCKHTEMVENYLQSNGQAAPSNRHPRSEFEGAIPHLEKIFEGLGKWEIVGSWRRGKSTFKDVDALICCTPEQFKEVYDRLSKDPDYQPTITGSAIIRGKYQGYDFDLYRCEDYEWGSQLLMRTGSAEFNIKMRGWLKKFGYSLNEHGLFNEGKLNLASASEQDIFNAIGIPYIKPEDRETAAKLMSELNKLPNGPVKKSSLNNFDTASIFADLQVPDSVKVSDAQDAIDSVKYDDVMDHFISSLNYGDGDYEITDGRYTFGYKFNNGDFSFYLNLDGSAVQSWNIVPVLSEINGRQSASDEYDPDEVGEVGDSKVSDGSRTSKEDKKMEKELAKQGKKIVTDKDGVKTTKNIVNNTDLLGQYKEASQSLPNNIYAFILWKGQLLSNRSKSSKNTDMEISPEFNGNKLIIGKKGDYYYLSCNGGKTVKVPLKKGIPGLLLAFTEAEVNGEVQVVRPKGRTLKNDRLEVTNYKLGNLGIKFPASFSNQVKSQINKSGRSAVATPQQFEFIKANKPKAAQRFIQVGDWFINQDCVINVDPERLNTKKLKFRTIKSKPLDVASYFGIEDRIDDFATWDLVPLFDGKDYHIWSNVDHEFKDISHISDNN